ncbi:ABC transporter permease [uncultured Methanobrevibacter sp.]|uniref:ABC transporter permease n=1 Tax=uncultured Methanobrevibacter sp. TaxID=253161 RepID=UPI00260654C5|nr:ABC transporter permease [uncultured Methanobrevibacter sp.]
MLCKKMLRDIKKHKTQFISIFLMAFLGVFVFTGVGGEALGLEANVNQFYEDTNLADGWIYSPYLNDLFVEQVYLLGATTQMERQVVVDSEAVIKNEPDVTLHFVENNTISKFYLVEGEPLDINDSNGVWLDKSFADANGFKVGDNISFEFEGYKINKVIRGVGYSPEYVYHASTYSVLPDFKKIGFAYLSYEAFPSDTVPYNVLNVKFKGSPDTFNEILDYRLDGYYITFLERSQHSSVSLFSDQISLHKMMADVFPMVFIAVSMLILLTTMTRIITHQRNQIGILKANGFKNSTIIWHYLSYGFWLVLIGSVLGLILGPMILPKFIYSIMDSMFILPSWNYAWSMNFIYMAVLMVLMSVVVSYFSVKVISDEKPSQSIKPRAPKVSSTGIIERLKIWRKLSFNVRWNYRDAKRNKFRALMTIIGVLGCVALLTCAFGLHDSVNDLMVWEFNKTSHYETEMIIDDGASQSSIDEVASDVNGDEIMKDVIEIESNSTKKAGNLLVLDGTDLVTPTDSDMNEIKIKDDEISISQKMADMLDVKVGDTIKWHMMDSNKWIESKIDRIHADPNSQGLIMSKEKLQDLDLNYTPTTIVTNEPVDKNYSAIKSFSSMEYRMEGWQNMILAAWVLIYVLIIFASFLSVVVLYNLGLLSFIEIEREIATLKVLGFKTDTLRRLLLTQNLWFSTIGFVLGIPLGYYILKTMWASAGDSYYVVPKISLTNFLLTAIITFSLSIIVNLMFSRKIKKLDMVESLKNGE